MILQCTQLIFRNLARRNFHTTKYTSLFYESPDKDGYQKPSEEELEWKKWSKMDKIKFELKLYKECIKEYLAQKKENFYEQPGIVMPEHHVEIIHKFTGDKDEMKKWVVSSDSDHGDGYSTAKLEYTRSSKALFHGFLDTKVPIDGKITRTGYCNMKMVAKKTPFRKDTSYDWGPYTHLVCRVRGDGRVYNVNLHLDSIFDVGWYDTYHYFIWTRGGPYWQYVRLPFSKFVFAYKGRIQVVQPPSIPKDSIKAISFTLADKITGPFKLEIDYIGVEYDPSHIEESAYESYSFGDHKFW